MARCVRVSEELYERLGRVADGLGVDRAEVARRALRRWRRLGGVVRGGTSARTTGGVVQGGKAACTTAGEVVRGAAGAGTAAVPFRLVDLGGLDEGLSAAGLREVLDEMVPRAGETGGRGPEVIREAGWAFRRDGTLV